jgi:hypothetical protein
MVGWDKDECSKEQGAGRKTQAVLGAGCRVGTGLAAGQTRVRCARGAVHMAAATHACAGAGAGRWDPLNQVATSEACVGPGPAPAALTWPRAPWRRRRPPCCARQWARLWRCAPGLLPLPQLPPAQPACLVGPPALRPRRLWTVEKIPSKRAESGERAAHGTAARENMTGAARTPSCKQ